MDSQEKLAWDSEVCCAVLGDPATGEFMLEPLDRALTEAENLKARLGGYQYAGVVGFKDGALDAQTADPACAYVMLGAALEFATRTLRPSDWLEQLYQLPDSREN